MFLKKAFDSYLNVNVLLKLLVALILGAITGIIFGQKIEFLQPFGDLFLRLLRMIVMPLMFFSLVNGIIKTGPKELRDVGIKALFFYVITTLLGAALAVFVGLAITSGININLASVDTVQTAPLSRINVVQMLLNIVPNNILQSLSSDDILAYMFFALVFGFAISSLKKEPRFSGGIDRFVDFIELTVNALIKIVGGILQYAPIGVFALIAIVFGRNGVKVFVNLGVLIIAVYVSLILFIALLLVYLKILKNINIAGFFAGVKEAVFTAYVTRSASATLPVALKNVEENLGVEKSISSFLLPLGVSIYKAGSAIYQIICVVFISSVTGISLDLAQYITAILLVLLGAVATASIPGGGVVALLIVLNAVGLNVTDNVSVAAAYALALGIDFILDMGRTCANVTSQMLTTVTFSKSNITSGGKTA